MSKADLTQTRTVTGMSKADLTQTRTDPTENFQFVQTSTILSNYARLTELSIHTDATKNESDRIA